MRVKMSKQPPPAPIASAVGPCPTVIQIVGRPGTGNLPSTIAIRKRNFTASRIRERRVCKNDIDSYIVKIEKQATLSEKKMLKMALI